MYCRDVAAAVDRALARGCRVVVVSQPRLYGERARERHISQQLAAAAMVSRRYRERSDVGYLDLGDAVDLRDGALAFDGMHLTAEGNARIAERLAPAIVAAAHAPEPSR
jgi:lysophospholipase L1-like esterase